MHCILCKPVWFNITQASYYTVSEELVGQPQPHVTSWKLQRELLLFLLNPSTDTPALTPRSLPGAALGSAHSRRRLEDPSARRCIIRLPTPPPLHGAASTPAVCLPCAEPGYCQSPLPAPTGLWGEPCGTQPQHPPTCCQSCAQLPPAIADS